MSVNELSTLITALGGLVGALSWPFIILLLIIYFGAPLRKFVAEMSQFSLKAGPTGLEASAKRQEVEAAFALGAAASQRDTKSPTAGEIPDSIATQTATVLEQASSPRTIRRLAGAKVLWVDDNPANNVYERRALEAFGIRFTLSTSTADALEQLRSNHFDAIITDMGRPGDPRAGYTLLDETRRNNLKTPLIIYASAVTPERRDEAQRKGAFGNTNNPQELFSLVVAAIGAS